MNTDETKPLMVRIEKAAAMLDVSPGTVRGLARDGALTIRRIRQRSVGILVSELEAFAAARPPARAEVDDLLDPQPDLKLNPEDWAEAEDRAKALAAEVGFKRKTENAA